MNILHINPRHYGGFHNKKPVKKLHIDAGIVFKILIILSIFLVIAFACMQE